MILLLFILPGCGKANNPSSSSQNTKTNKSSTVGAVTYENYLKIQLGMTYKDVEGILGAGSETNAKSNVVSYSWGENSGKTINVQISQDKVVSKTQTMLGKTTSTLTADQFNKIKKGLTLDQVVSILGQNYQESSYKKSGTTDRRVLVWMKPDTTNITVVFQDDKVVNMYNFLK
jgi:Beta-lactamase inhibitor (BLIP).